MVAGEVWVGRIGAPTGGGVMNHTPDLPPEELEAIENRPDVTDWWHEKCPECNREGKVRHTNLRACMRTGDENMAVKQWDESEEPFLRSEIARLTMGFKRVVSALKTMGEQLGHDQGQSVFVRSSKEIAKVNQTQGQECLDGKWPILYR